MLPRKETKVREYPRVRVCGDARERGRQYGETTRERVRLSVNAYGEVFGAYTGWDWPTVRNEAKRFEEPIRAYNERYLEEIYGLAEGACLQAEDILAINVRTEVMFAAKARQALSAGGPRRGECSAVAALPEATRSRHTILGQNWDWLLHCFDTVVVLEVEQDAGPNFVTVVEAGLLAKTGMNSSGIGLVTNALVTAADVGRPGVPFHVLLRAILDAETLTDALVALQRLPRSSSANYLVAHEDGIAVNVEAAPGDFGQLFLLFPENGVFVHTNHFLSPAFKGRDVSVWAMPDSPFRLERFRSAVVHELPDLELDSLERLFADHVNYPLGICCHPDTRLSPLDQSATVASLLMDLDTRCLWLSDGYPCESEFREIDYAELLSKPSPVRAALAARG
jgi:isopenicillin-N N-acyltransferase like protein